MIVADASAIIQILGPGGVGKLVEARLFGHAEPVCAPYLVDAEVASVLRKHVLLRRLSEARARDALSAFLALSLVRFPHVSLLARVFALRDRLSAYDALYVALAESLGAALITCDHKLARAAAGVVQVEAF